MGRRRRAGYRAECRRTRDGHNGGVGLMQTAAAAAAALVAAACKDDHHVSVLRRVEVATRY